jgi:hypothetical protein
MKLLKVVTNLMIVLSELTQRNTNVIQENMDLVKGYTNLMKVNLGRLRILNTDVPS